MKFIVPLAAQHWYQDRHHEASRQLLRGHRDYCDPTATSTRSRRQLRSCGDLRGVTRVPQFPWRLHGIEARPRRDHNALATLRRSWQYRSAPVEVTAGSQCHHDPTKVMARSRHDLRGVAEAPRVFFPFLFFLNYFFIFKFLIFKLNFLL